MCAYVKYRKSRESHRLHKQPVRSGFKTTDMQVFSLTPSPPLNYFLLLLKFFAPPLPPLHKIFAPVTSTAPPNVTLQLALDLQVDGLLQYMGLVLLQYMKFLS